ncbi:MAG: fepD, partial [Frankiales bacterium]|nr:fepD [Frankiales bacterium]
MLVQDRPDIRARPAPVRPRRAWRRVLPPLALVLLLAVLASLLVGSGQVGPGRALRVLLGGSDEEARFAVLQLRWPRTIVATVVGAALGAAGAVLQAA